MNTDDTRFLRAIKEIKTPVGGLISKWQQEVTICILKYPEIPEEITKLITPEKRLYQRETLTWAFVPHPLWFIWIEQVSFKDSAGSTMKWRM